jgi:hypothetical protein
MNDRFQSGRWFALAATALFVAATPVHAKSTGKLEGRVRDQARVPIPGAQLHIEGTTATAL